MNPSRTASGVAGLATPAGGKGAAETAVDVGGTLAAGAGVGGAACAGPAGATACSGATVGAQPTITSQSPRMGAMMAGRDRRGAWLYESRLVDGERRLHQRQAAGEQ